MFMRPWIKDGIILSWNTKNLRYYERWQKPDKQLMFNNPPDFILGHLLNNSILYFRFESVMCQYGLVIKLK